MSKSTGKFFLAGMLGAIAGAVGGLLMAPKSGKETREDIMALAVKLSKKIKTEANETKIRVGDVFGKVTEDANTKYDEIKNAVISKVATIKTAGEQIDKEKYGKVVEGVVAEIAGDLGVTKAGVTKMIGYLKKDWERVRKALS